MPGFTMRDDAPLTKEEWGKIDELVVGVARKLLVGRRIIKLAGPYGAGLQMISLDSFEVGEACVHDESCEGDCDCECQAVHIASREVLSLAVIHKDFSLRWRDIETARQFGSALDLSPVAAAAAACAQAEDKMVFDGLLGKAGSKIEAAAWDEEGNGFANVVAATEALISGGFYGPYAAALPPALYAKMHRLMGRGGRLEVEHIGKMAAGGVFQAPGLKTPFVIAQGVQDLDLVVGQDLITAYLGPEMVDHRFRVLESLVLRVKRAGAICVMG
jgi:uncharacterized linocin/CFP29 family protein